MSHVGLDNHVAVTVKTASGIEVVCWVETSHCVICFMSHVGLGTHSLMSMESMELEFAAGA